MPPFENGEKVDLIETPSLEALNPAAKRETTRSSIALAYVVGFLAIVVLATIGAFILLAMNKIEFQDVTNTLVTISGILSGPLGFIIGYYFKSQTGDEI